MMFRHPIGNGLTIRPDLDAAKNVCSRRGIERIAHAVGFNETDAQVVGATLARNDRHRHKDVSTHQSRKEHQGLKLKECLPALGVAVHAFRPQTPFAFGVLFPFLRLLLCETEELRVDLCIQRKTGTDNVRSYRLQSAGRKRRPHVEIARAIAKRFQVVNDVRIRIASAGQPSDQGLLCV